MLARRCTLDHRHAGKVDLPLMVPAFSSKGFNFLAAKDGKKKRPYSELSNLLADFAAYQATSVLVSAYDLHFRHLVPPDARPRTVTSSLRNVRLVFIDSGGYELTRDFDSTETKVFGYEPRDGFGLPEYERVLAETNKKSRDIHCVAANFDTENRGVPLREQIVRGRNLFRKFPAYSADFIIKPFGSDKNTIDVASLSRTDFRNLAGFDIIGVTEKELGTKLIDRLRNIALLRRGLDEEGIHAPIHVWGGLDPVLSPLMFFSGAQIFDGVSWLRYAFREGRAINLDSNIVLDEKIGITVPFDQSRALTRIDNLRFLDNLSISLQQWVDYDGTNFDMFHHSVRDRLKQGYSVMVTKKII